MISDNVCSASTASHVSVHFAKWSQTLSVSVANGRRAASSKRRRRPDGVGEVGECGFLGAVGRGCGIGGCYVASLLGCRRNFVKTEDTPPESVLIVRRGCVVAVVAQSVSSGVDTSVAFGVF